MEGNQDPNPQNIGPRDLQQQNNVWDIQPNESAK